MIEIQKECAKWQGYKAIVEKIKWEAVQSDEYGQHESNLEISTMMLVLADGNQVYVEHLCNLPLLMRWLAK